MNAAVAGDGSRAVIRAALAEQAEHLEDARARGGKLEPIKGRIRELTERMRARGWDS